MGYAFCVFQDPSVTDMACAALNGIKMGDKTLTVRRAVQGGVQPKPEQKIDYFIPNSRLLCRGLCYSQEARPPRLSV
uniref:RRM domain-containing protein n=1 Tax=Brassica campestris TaxID=3711 RepID=A0A3P5YI41_BRACM|nr:unnamed protein product [Brassica rapa]